MKKLTVVLGIVGLLVIGSKLYAQAFGSEGHIVSELGGTNVTIIASNSTASAVIGQSITNGSVRWQSVINNTNPVGVAVKFSGTFPTNATPDMVIPGNSHPALYWAEGYNGPISMRATNNTALTLIYNEMYR